MTHCLKLKLGDPEKNIGYLIWRVTKFWYRGKNKLLEEFDITTSQMEVMGAIYHLTEKHKEVTQIILSQAAQIDPMTVSTILKNLQKKGLIIRRESEVDTRARSVFLTSEGEALFVRAVMKVQEIEEKVFENLDREALRAQLQFLLNELNKANNQI